MLSFFKNPEEKIIKSHLGRLISLAKSDGEFHKEEQKLIVKIGTEHGISPKELNNLMFHTHVYDDDIPTSADDRFYQLMDFVKLMAEDGHISKAEIKLYHSLASQLSFKMVIQDVLLEKIKRGLDNERSKIQIKQDCEAFIMY